LILRCLPPRYFRCHIFSRCRHDADIATPLMPLLFHIFSYGGAADAP
jgi:hypothetical protein